MRAQGTHRFEIRKDGEIEIDGVVLNSEEVSEFVWHCWSRYFTLLEVKSLFFEAARQVEDYQAKGNLIQNVPGLIVAVLRRLLYKQWLQEKRWQREITNFKALEELVEKQGSIQDPCTEVWDEYVATELRAAIRRLPDTYRAAVWLYMVEEFSMAEIARALDITVENARQRVSRGRKCLATDKQLLAVLADEE